MKKIIAGLVLSLMSMVYAQGSEAYATAGLLYLFSESGYMYDCRPGFLQAANEVSPLNPTEQICFVIPEARSEVVRAVTTYVTTKHGDGISSYDEWFSDNLGGRSIWFVNTSGAISDMYFYKIDNANTFVVVLHKE